MTAVREVREEAGAEVAIIRCLGEESFEEDSRQLVYVWYLVELVAGVPAVREPAGSRALSGLDTAASPRGVQCARRREGQVRARSGSQ